ncbi:hypothetical protein QZH41_000384 [Actinostola sp. cb2023]|nr:hypothetical protein QZH41_000384 [Actinostola sp. cb2023]
MFAVMGKRVEGLKDLGSPDEWQVVESIGEGTYGEVFKVRNIKTDQLAAAKVIDSILEKIDEVLPELEILKKYSDHPNVAGFFGAYIKRDTKRQDQLWLVMELCRGGSVTNLARNLISKGKLLEEDLIAYILYETLKVLYARSKPPTMRNPEKWSHEYRDFIAKCLIKDYEERSNGKDLLTHPFLCWVPTKVDALRRKLRGVMDSQYHGKDGIMDEVKREKESSQGKDLSVEGPYVKPSARRNKEMLMVDDLTTLPSLTDEVILSHLLERFLGQQIYTYIGDILIAVNPLQSLRIYTKKVTHYLSHITIINIIIIAITTTTTIITITTATAIIIITTTTTTTTTATTIIITTTIIINH